MAFVRSARLRIWYQSSEGADKNSSLTEGSLFEITIGYVIKAFMLNCWNCNLNVFIFHCKMKMSVTELPISVSCCNIFIWICMYGSENIDKKKKSRSPLPRSEDRTMETSVIVKERWFKVVALTTSRKMELSHVWTWPGLLPQMRHAIFLVLP